MTSALMEERAMRLFTVRSLSNRISAMVTFVFLLIASYANANVIFSEDFSALAPSGSYFPADSSFPDSSSERGAGMYRIGAPTIPGWTLAGPVMAFDRGGEGDQGGTGNMSLLLNEPGSAISRTLTGLTIGQTYRLAFEVWGDNRITEYALKYEINGVTNTFTDTSSGLNSGNFNTLYFDFAASSTSTLFKFSEASLTQASPILDNISITAVPLPAAAWLFGTALAGLGFGRKYKQREALVA